MLEQRADRSATDMSALEQYVKVQFEKSNEKHDKVLSHVSKTEGAFIAIKWLLAAISFLVSVGLLEKFSGG